MTTGNSCPQAGGCTCRCVTSRDKNGKATGGCAVGDHPHSQPHGHGYGCHIGEDLPGKSPATTVGQPGVKRTGFRKGQNPAILKDPTVAGRGKGKKKKG